MDPYIAAPAEDLSLWIGREAAEDDVVSSGVARRFQATVLDAPGAAAEGEAAPLLMHWLLFLPAHPMSQNGPDGHARRGAFLPPVALPRRMWAGSKIEFLRPLIVGRPVTRRSVISDVVEKTGRTGRLVFVTVDHEISDADGLCIRDRHEIVYRDLPGAGAPAAPASPAPSDPQWSRAVVPDPVLLFRYSALTFNGHRIHYDRTYATQEEGYPGLVVHGPLIATLLLHELARRRPKADVVAFGFRALRPIFDTAGFQVCGSLTGDTRASLFAADHTGALCMEATATLR